MAEKKVLVSDQIKEENLPAVAESIIDEFRAREKRRGDQEKIWDEIDRQLAMTPELSHKKFANGDADPTKAWMPETELPLQAQTLEMLMSDNRRLKFPSNRDWFKARAALTEKYLTRFQKAGSPITGERGNSERIVLNQDNADKLAQAQLSYWHSQYDFRSHLELVDAEAFKYGFGAGRMKKVHRRILGHDARLDGKKDQHIPVFIPRSSRKVYLDDNEHAVMHEGFTLGPNIIQHRTMQHADLVAAADAGGSDPKDEEGGYLLSQINLLTPDKKGEITLIELEGDLVVDVGSKTIIEKDIIVTAATCKKGRNTSFGLVRYRQRGDPFSSYLISNYHVEGVGSFPSSPLIKGMPVARTAAQALNRVIESAQLKNGPPVGYPRDEIAFAADGGPVVEPYAIWETVEEVRTYIELGGDPATLFAVFTGLVNLYYDVTGVNQPRLGAQTKSHTTAFAKDVEITQGSVRTVDYVKTTLEGPMTRLLSLEYRMGLKDMTGKNTIFVPDWNEFVSLERNHLPDIVKFSAFGAAAPAEDVAEQQRKLAAAQLAMSMEQFSLSVGNDPSLDVKALIRQVLNEGGWTDISEITLEIEAEPRPPGNGSGEQPGGIPPELNAVG